ncbi:hypothetical protein D3C86_1422210 [compost metagenome]
MSVLVSLLYRYAAVSMIRAIIKAHWAGKGFIPVTDGIQVSGCSRISFAPGAISVHFLIAGKAFGQKTLATIIDQVCDQMHCCIIQISNFDLINSYAIIGIGSGQVGIRAHQY